MVGIDISKLGMDELKRLSEVARLRGQTTLADALANELRTRPMRAAGWQAGAWAPALAVQAQGDLAAAHRASTPMWALAAAATLALILGWGWGGPAGRVLDAEVILPGALAFAEAPVANALCTARLALGEDRDCGAPLPLADMGPAPGAAPAT
ncbi:MAG: hypothetical protein DI570_15740 [Phenylobacterium zucineum]|nr:MAG: hypothetical protein DI570_15740 [Phenylobacterium zucineum]